MLSKTGEQLMAEKSVHDVLGRPHEKQWELVTLMKRCVSVPSRSDSSTELYTSMMGMDELRWCRITHKLMKALAACGPGPEATRRPRPAADPVALPARVAGLLLLLLSWLLPLLPLLSLLPRTREGCQ